MRERLHAAGAEDGAQVRAENGAGDTERERAGRDGERRPKTTLCTEQSVVLESSETKDVNLAGRWHLSGGVGSIRVWLRMSEALPLPPSQTYSTNVLVLRFRSWLRSRTSRALDLHPRCSLRRSLFIGINPTK